VSREALIHVLESASEVPVVLVSAGPGWGKTTLLVQWAARSKRPFAWVTVNETDNDPVVLLTYIATAIDRVERLDPGVFEALASPGASVEGTIVPRIGAALATVEQPLVLVLDDLHLLREQACLGAVATLMRHFRDGSQLVLSARGARALPLGALATPDLRLELGPDDLGMDSAEADELLRAAAVELKKAEVADITQQTEGWPAGLSLAALSMRAHGAKRAAAFSGADLLVSDYLESEVLAEVSLAERRFLTRTAVLKRLSGPLCDAVLEVSGSAATLESLARANLFLVPLDRDGEWYRYHHLFRQLLRSELSRTEPELVPRLLARAADWWEADGQMERAIECAQEAGDVDRVARLVERCALPAYQSGRVATAEGWLHWLETRGALERNAAVAVLGAIVATFWGRAAEAERWADAAAHGSYQGGLPDGSASIDSWLALLSALRCQRGVARMREDAELALRTLARGSPFRPNAALLLAMSHWLAGEINAADDLFVDAAEEGLELGAVGAAAVALAERAVIAVGRGAWVDAEQLADRALRACRRARMEDYPSSAFVYAVAARVALHRGEAQRAHELLAQAQRLRPGLTDVVPYFSIQTRLELARAYLTLADADGATTLLREISAILRRRPDLGTLSAEVQELRSSLHTIRTQAPGASTLTEAELRMLPYLATHLSFREIGERLFLSRHTVKSHAMAIYHKLGVTSRNGAVERARELGLLST
jgi:LuxR family maltose regulon positive regulatory protein